MGGQLTKGNVRPRAGVSYSGEPRDGIWKVPQESVCFEPERCPRSIGMVFEGGWDWRSIWGAAAVRTLDRNAHRRRVRGLGIDWVSRKQLPEKPGYQATIKEVPEMELAGSVGIDVL